VAGTPATPAPPTTAGTSTSTSLVHALVVEAVVVGVG
jgi:multisubunit Na+/H+ antiporter MnhC subunit